MKPREEDGAVQSVCVYNTLTRPQSDGSSPARQLRTVAEVDDMGTVRGSEPKSSSNIHAPRLSEVL